MKGEPTKRDWDAWEKALRAAAAAAYQMAVEYEGRSRKKAASEMRRIATENEAAAKTARLRWKSLVRSKK